MQYVWTHAITQAEDGWGIVGVFPKDVVDNAPKAKGDGRPIVSGKHLIVGQGGGWDSPGTFDEEWMKKAVELMNREESKADMKPEEKAAIVNARCTTALIRAMGMMAENQQRFTEGHSTPYAEEDFAKVIEEEGTHWNAIHKVLFQ